MEHATSNRHASRNPRGPSYTPVIAGIRLGGAIPARTPYTGCMGPPRPPRDPERGNSLLLALIVMSALATLGSLTVVSMQSSIQMSTNDRAQTIAMYAAESGAAVAMDFLRKSFDASGTAPYNATTTWGDYCTANNEAPVDMSTVISSSDARPGDAAHHNLFGPDQNAWFHIDILNNRDDPGYGTNPPNCDNDGILIIRSTGHGPGGSLAIIEWTVQRVGYWGSVTPPAPAPALASPFQLPDGLDPGQGHNPPSLSARPGWTPWLPQALDSKGGGPAPENVGVVLLGWRIVL